MALVIKRLIEKHGYLSVEGCLRLIQHYIKLNQNEVYANGKLEYKHLKPAGGHFESSRFMSEILKECGHIRENIFVSFERVLELLVKRKVRGEKPSFR